MINRVFNGNLQPDSYSISDDIGNAIGFFIIAPDIVNDVQIDVFLQLEISENENRQVRLFEGLTENDTRTILPIPQEYERTNTKKYFAIFSSFNVNIELYVIEKDDSIDTEKLVEIQDVLDTISENVSIIRDTDIIQTTLTGAIGFNAVAQNTALGLLAVSLAPLTLGTSLAVEPPLLSGATSLSTALLLLTGI